MNHTRPNSGARTHRRGIAVTKLLVLIGGLVGAGAVTIGVATRPQPQVAQTASSLDIAVARVMDFDVTTTATGELEAAKQIEIRNRLDKPTTIVEIIPEGEHVKQGQLLVKLNADEVQEQVDREQLEVETAKAQLAAAESSYSIQVSENESLIRKAKLAFDLAELDLRQWLEGDVASTRQDLTLALDKANREFDRLRDKFDRSKGLESRGFLSKDELKRDELAFLEAQAAVKTAQLNQRVFDEFQFPKDRKTKESAVEEARSELERSQRKAESELATKEAERTNRRRQAELRESRLNKLKEQVVAATLRAPSDGLVVYSTSMEKNRWGWGDSGGLQIGQQVHQNQPLIYLPDTSEMVASVRVSESLAGRITKGQPATIKIDALGGRSLRGEVESVGILAEQGGWRDPNLREYTVKIKLIMEAGVAVRPSMRCEAEIQVDRIESALAVPVQAVFTEGLVRYVHVPQGSKFARRPVKVGRRSDRFAEITAGITEGERTLVRKPEAREVLGTPWVKEDLLAVGLDLTADGKITPKGAPLGAEAAASDGSTPPKRPQGANRNAERRREGGAGGGGGGTDRSAAPAPK